MSEKRGEGIVARKNVFLKTVALVVIFGPVVLLWLGVSYGILSARQWAIGGFAWAALLPVLIVILRRWLARRAFRSTGAGDIALDEDTRKRLSRGIRIRKAWIGALAILLPIGIARGVAQRAWLPLLGGVGINLSLIYLALSEIKQRRKRLSLTESN